jgi:hypothetical protein
LVGLNYISVYTLSDGATHEIPTGFDDNANPAIRLKSDADQLMALGVSEGEVDRFFTQRMVEATSRMRVAAKLDKYLAYIDNAGGLVHDVWFDEDWEPIGKQVRAELEAAGLIEYVTEGDHNKSRRKH